MCTHIKSLVLCVNWVMSWQWDTATLGAQHLTLRWWILGKKVVVHHSNCNNSTQLFALKWLILYAVSFSPSFKTIIIKTLSILGDSCILWLGKRHHLGNVTKLSHLNTSQCWLGFKWTAAILQGWLHARTHTHRHFNSRSPPNEPLQPPSDLLFKWGKQPVANQRKSLVILLDFIVYSPLLALKYNATYTVSSKKTKLMRGLRKGLWNSWPCWGQYSQ